MLHWNTCCCQKGKLALSNLALHQISYWSPSQKIVEKEEDTSNIVSQEKLPSSSYKQEILCFLPTAKRQLNIVET